MSPPSKLIEIEVLTPLLLASTGAPVATFNVATNCVNSMATASVTSEKSSTGEVKLVMNCGYEVHPGC